MPLPASPPLLLTLPERLRLGLASRRVLSWGCGVRWDRGWGWVAVISGKAGIFSSTAHLPCLPPLALSPACCRGPSRPPGSTITRPSAPCHLLKISPTPFWFIFCSDVCSPHAHPPPKKNTEKGNRCELGCRAARLGLLPQHDVLGCMPGVVEEPSPTAESSLELTSSFFAATLATLAGGGCSVEWE